MTKRTFITMFGNAHWDSQNLYVYKNDEVIVVAEKVGTGKELGSMKFENLESAKEWFDNLSGSDNLNKTITGLEILQA